MPIKRARRLSNLHLRQRHRSYAIGDIHGRADLLRALMARIREDIRRFPADSCEFIFLGDYISRGPHSDGVIDFLLEELPHEGVPMICLRGNHEDLLLRFLRDGDQHAGQSWLSHGGAEAAQAYGVETGEITPQRLPQIAQKLRERIPDKHMIFFEELQACYIRDGYIFVHAGLRPGVRLEEQTATDMMWIREGFLDYRGHFPKYVIHGHTPSDLPTIRPNRTNVDTRAYEGVLTCAVLEGRERRFLTTL